jgi:endonuclease/exonuclease/phosphatase family metal-dependent hydrolase
MKTIFKFILLTFFLLFPTSELLATSATPQLIICSQNLERFGSHTGLDGMTQESYLVQRFIEAKCDIIAVQEIFGAADKVAELNLNQLAKSLSKKSNREFDHVLGEIGRDQIRNGFLIAKNSARVEKTFSYPEQNLPRLSLAGSPTRFTRPPLAIIIQATPNLASGGASQKKFVLTSFHFKSKVNGWKDRAKTNYETTRMEMAEGLREWVKFLLPQAGPDGVIFFLGDRNSNERSASAQILRGTRSLDNFRSRACWLNDYLEPDCEKLPPRAPILSELMSTRYAENPRQDREGTFSFRNNNELIDEILTNNLKIARRPDGSLAVGTTGKFGQGSDHKLVWAELRWN